MKRTYYIARGMIDGRSWDLSVFSSMPKPLPTQDMNGCTILYEGEKMFSFWNLEQLLPNICPSKGCIYRIELEEIDDVGYVVRRVKL